MDVGFSSPQHLPLRGICNLHDRSCRTGVARSIRDASGDLQLPDGGDPLRASILRAMASVALCKRIMRETYLLKVKIILRQGTVKLRHYGKDWVQSGSVSCRDGRGAPLRCRF